MKTCWLLFASAFVFLKGASAFASDTNKAAVISCDAEISIRLKEPAKEIKTNEPVIVIVQIKNTSTNEMLTFMIHSSPMDFTWNITSPSGKDLSPTNSLPEFGASWNPKLSPQESRDSSYNLSEICNFNELGTYKIIARNQVLSSFTKRKVCEIISNPLEIKISK
ncbi:MAG TPA: hypothetical protein VFV23_04755 [Verrucomicrobiae bacterium]|nr:hypothetical protein [Verrucomicrobiae bacterium]